MNVYDLVPPQELIGFVREILNEESRNPLSLAQFLPNRNIVGITYRLTTGVLRDVAAAPVRPFDTPAPIGKRQGVTRKIGELLPISKKIDLAEEQTLRLRAAQTGNNSGLIDGIFNDAETMARAVAVRVEQLRGEALWSGQINLNENGVQQVLDFGRNGAHTVAPATLWSDTVNAVPVTNLIAWQQTYRATNGVGAAYALISSRILGYLSVNAQIRGLAVYNGNTPPFLGLGEINRLMQTNGLPQFVVNDTQVRNINDVATRVIPDDKVVLVPPANEPLGSTLWGETAESTELIEAQQIGADDAPGVVAVVMKTFDPVATWTKAAGIVMPIVANPDLTFTADVA